ncbi:MAG: glycerol-3-phosphate 1-O-acyltransferase PlsY, partial [Nitrospiria bacterium]
MKGLILEIGMVVVGYLLGSIPFGLLFSTTIYGIDPRKKGSGNIGATNVLRVVGKKAAFLTLVCDVLKGFAPIAVARHIGFNEEAILVVGLAVILGHIFSIYLGFKGGKGVATSFGVFLVISPQIAFIALIFWGGSVLISKYAAVGALTAFGALPFLAFFLKREFPFVLLASTVSVLVCFRHKDNIHRLLKGTE